MENKKKIQTAVTLIILVLQEKFVGKSEGFNVYLQLWTLLIFRKNEQEQKYSAIRVF